MGKIPNSQSGFSVVEALLIFVIVGILGFTGYFVWHAKENANRNLKADNSTLPVYKQKSKSAKNSVASTAVPSSSIDQQVATAFKGYNTLPNDFKPLLTSEYQKTVAACKNNPDAVANGVSAGGTVQQVVRNQFISINEQEEDCAGGSATYYSKINGQWQRDFLAQMAPSCELVNKYSYTKLIIPMCYTTNGTATVQNTNP